MRSLQAARRIAYGIFDEGATQLTRAGWAVFDASVAWLGDGAAGGGTTQVPVTLYDFEYGYDEAGNVTYVNDGRSNDWTYTYNVWGLSEDTVEPQRPLPQPQEPDEDRTFTLSYDAGGLPTNETLAGGVVVSSVYDKLGRRTQLSSGTAIETAGYDLVGRKTSISHPGGTQSFVFDDRGQLVGSDGPAGNTVYRYDPRGLLTQRDDAAGTWGFSYTNRGQLETASDPQTGLVATYSYNGDSTVDTVSYGAAVGTRSYTYNDAGRLATDQWVTGSATVWDAAYVYGNDGNITQRIISAGTAGANAGNGVWGYQYDEAGRLIEWTHAAVTNAVTWDQNGNRLSAGADTFSYDERNRLQTSPAGEYSWDPRGTLNQIVGGGAMNAAFDGLGRMTSVTTAGTVTYDYDGLDRVATRNATAFSYNGGAIDPVTVGGETYGRGPGGNVASVNTATATVAVTDRHGDLVATISTDGTLASSRTYDPFGDPVDTIGTPGALGYQSDYTDPTTGGVWMGARWLE